MNHDNGHGMDPQARRLHQAALAQVSPQTLMRLRTARHEAGLQASPVGQGRTWRWLTATAFSAVLAVGIGLQWLPRTPTVPTSVPVAAIPSDGDAIVDELGVAGTFDEDPDLYLWLASADAQPLAMESTR